MALPRSGSHRFGWPHRYPWRSPWADAGPRFRRSADLVAAAAFTALAASQAFFMPLGNPIRVFITLVFLLTVPGYLLIQALVVPARPAASRWVHALLGVGISPAIVGLLALSTALIPGGFHPVVIIAIVISACAALAAAAFGRRSLHSGQIRPTDSSTPHGIPSGLAHSAGPAAK